MLNKKVFIGKSKKAVLEQIQNDLDVELEDLYIDEETINGGLFKGQKYRFEVLTKSDVKNYIGGYIEEFSQKIDINIQYELSEEDGIFKVLLVSENNPILIGREGKTLECFQILLRQSLLKNTGHPIKVNVDISGYKEKKMKKLQEQIQSIAQEILDTKIDVSLDPMNSYERRKVHSIISEIKHLKTESIGEGKERHIIIKYTGE